MRRSRGVLGFWRSALCVGLLVLLGRPVLAQLSSASLNGVVRDPSGAVVANASVGLRNVDTTVERTTVSNDAGNYVFQNITPGRYTLKVTASGFKSKQVSEFVLAVNQTATIDIPLEVGSQIDMITVEAGAEQLKVSTADLGTVIATRQVNDLPLNAQKLYPTSFSDARCRAGQRFAEQHGRTRWWIHRSHRGWFRIYFPRGEWTDQSE